MTEQAVITVNATIMMGTCVYWFRSVGDAERQQVLLTASREGVQVGRGYLTDIPDQWITDARRAHHELAGNPGADMSGWATHVHRGPPNGPLVPVQEVSRG